MTRKCKLDTPEEIETVCWYHYLTSTKMDQIARHFNVSEGVVRRILREHGQAYHAAHKKEIDEFRNKYHGWS